jgi:hypothetical protein
METDKKAQNDFFLLDTWATQLIHVLRRIFICQQRQAATAPAKKADQRATRRRKRINVRREEESGSTCDEKLNEPNMDSLKKGADC